MRLSKQLWSKLPWKRRGVLPLLGFVLTLGLLEASRSGFFWAYLSYSRYDLGLSQLVIGTAWTIHALTETFSRSLGGYIAQRLGLTLTMLASGVAGLLTLLLVAHYPSAWMLWGTSLLWGFTFSALWPGLMTLTSRIARGGREGRALAFTSSLVLPFSGAGTFLTGFLVQRNLDWAHNALLIALGASVLIGLSLIRYREPVATYKQELYPWQKLLTFLPAAFGQTFAPAMLSLLIIKFADKELGLRVLELAAVIGVGGLIAFVGIGWFGRIADRQGPRVPLVLGMICLSAAFLWVAQKPGFAEMFVVAVLAGVGFALFMPSWNALVVRLLPQQNRAAIWGTLLTAEGLGTATGPAVGGLLWNTFGPTAPFYGGAAVFVLLALFYVLSLRGMVWKSSVS